MVSFWPFGKDDSSAASFEKTLSKLSEHITKSSIRLDTLRTRSRRVKALWTLYTSIAYLLFTLILTLVLGPKNWDIPHYAGVIGAPILIYGVRKGTTAFYDWRISSEEAYLNDLQKQRDTTIDKLKAATKYNSTQELLNKYGGNSKSNTPSKSPAASGQKKKGTPSPATKPPPPTGRTGIAPPPTANIPGRNLQASNPSTPVRPPSAQQPGRNGPTPDVPFVPDEPGFAPNAFPGAPQPYPQQSQFQPQSPHWYDRLMDVLLGEDETASKNRLALICSNCRLVNGQAPPGVKTLDDVGKWRCGGCGSWNGEESEARKVLEAMKQKQESDRKEGWEVVSRGDEVKDEEEEEPTVSKAPRRQTKTVIPSSDDEGEDEEEVENEKAEDEDTNTTRKRVTRSAKKTEDLVEL